MYITSLLRLKIRLSYSNRFTGLPRLGVVRPVRIKEEAISPSKPPRS
jgi:hypothetical protein